MTSTRTPGRLRVFLCHSAHDKPAVRELYNRLRADGFAPWLDEEDLLPGQDWRVEIAKAVEAAHGVIVCLSRTAVNPDGFKTREIAYALDLARTPAADPPLIIPLLLEPCTVPDDLAHLHWVEYRQPLGYARLVKALRARALALGLAEPESGPSLP